MADSTDKGSYRNPLADVPDQALFFTMFGIGAAAIWFLKARGLSQFTVTTVPVALMVLYAAIALITKRYRLREDKVGDNIYYLGFLYTLTSLAYAMYVYRPDGSGAADIITNFGIAIFTTILGLAGRIFFNQMREDPVEYEREARYSLAEALRSMHAQLDDIGNEAALFKRRLAQILEEGMLETSEKTRSSLEENVKQFGAASNMVVGRIDEAFASFTEHSTRLNEISAQSVSVLEALLERIEKIDVSPQMLASKFEPVLDIFKEAASETAKRNRTQGNDLKRMRDAVEAINSSSESLQKQIDGTNKALTRQLEAVNVKLDSAAGTLARIVQSFNDAKAAIGGDLSGDSRSGGLSAIVEQETKAAGVAISALCETVDEQRVAVTHLREAIAEDLEVARRHRDAIGAILVESQEALRQFETTLVGLTRALVEQVDAR
jgi:hypothetical protein